MTELLELLRDRPEHWRSLQQLQSALRMSAPAVHAQIDTLRGHGHEVEFSPLHGVRLRGFGALNADVIEAGLNVHRAGRRVLVYDQTDSTNDVAWTYADAAGYDGLAVFAEQQRAGRGRLQRCWEAPPRTSVLCSLLLQEGRHLTAQMLTLLAPIATAEVVEAVASISTAIKWPNDVMVDGMKLAGVMVESKRIHDRDAYVIGIGINCLQQRDDFPPELRRQSTSLALSSAVPCNRVDVARQLLRTLDRWLDMLETQNVEPLHEGWLSRCDDIGARRAVISDGREYVGRVLDVCPDRGLVMHLDNGAVRVFDAATTTVKK